MEIELLRDLVIIISGILVIVIAIFVAVISYSLYRKVNSIIDSAKTTAAKIEALTLVAADEIGKPLIEAAGFVQGIAQGICAIKKMFKKGG